MTNGKNGKNGTDKEYVMAYGFRRYTACKKLGWKTIPAYIQKENKLIDLPIEDIVIIDNTRVNDNSEGFIELMQSIKTHGLLEPIGVWRSKDLTRMDFLVTNLLENIQRKDISPFELGKAIKELKSFGLNEKEIAVRLSIPYSRIQSLTNVINQFSPEVIKKTSFLSNDRLNAGGKLSVTMLSKIGSMRLKKKQTEKLVNSVQKNAYSTTDVDLITRLVYSGMSMEQALKNKDKYIAVRPIVVMKKDVLKKNKLTTISNTAVVNGMLTGQLPLNKKLFFFNKKIQSVKDDED